MAVRKRLLILGSTGSIGTQALDVCTRSDVLELVGLSAESSWETRERDWPLDPHRARRQAGNEHSPGTRARAGGRAEAPLKMSASGDTQRSLSDA
jgi:hypothetical protein